MNAVTRWNPIRELDNLHDRVLRALYRRSDTQDEDGMQSLTAAEWSPVVDIVEDDKEYLIKAELPEVPKEDVKITLDNGVVTIRGERKLEKEEDNRRYHRIERSYGCFVRSFTLPSDADPGRISADFKDGMLQVRLAKCEEKKPRQIEVKVD